MLRRDRGYPWCLWSARFVAPWSSAQSSWPLSKRLCPLLGRSAFSLGCRSWKGNSSCGSSCAQSWTSRHTLSYFVIFVVVFLSHITIEHFFIFFILNLNKIQITQVISCRQWLPKIYMCGFASAAVCNPWLAECSPNTLRWAHLGFWFCRGLCLNTMKYEN